MTKDEDAQRRQRPEKRERPERANADSPPSRDVAARTRQRIAKAIARAGLCSRRDAEAWVVAGRVTVNGEMLSSPARDVGPEDEITVDGVPLPAADKTRLFLFHKPRGLVTSDHDPEGRDTVADFLRDNWPEGPRVVTVGRLDINTEGLLLLTNDGGLARVLELPETGWLRRYRVRAKGETDQARLDALAGGIEIDGIHYAGIEAKLDRVQGSNCWLTMGLREGKNREIKRVLEHLGMGVNRLIRVSFGPFQLLDLPEGAVEEVRTRVLRDQLGDALATSAGVSFDDGAAEPAGPDVKRASSGGGEGGNRPRFSSSAGEPRGRSRNSEQQQAPVERQPRPAGPRRHVAALRASEDTMAQTAPRKRIERSNTKDRHDRTIVVERHVAANERSDARKSHRSTSPSAQAKRMRIARSGGTGRFAGSQANEEGGRTPRSGKRGADHAGADRRRERSNSNSPPTHAGPRGTRAEVRPARFRGGGQADGEREGFAAGAGSRPQRSERKERNGPETRTGRPDEPGKGRSPRVGRGSADMAAGKGERSPERKRGRSPAPMPRSGPRPSSRAGTPSGRPPRGGPRGSSKPKR